MIKKNTALHPQTWVNSNLDSSRNSARARRVLPRRNSPASLGAVRLSAELEPRFRHMRKISAGLVFVAGGILFTTTSTGTVKSPVIAMKMATLLPVPTFFFADDTNALGTKAQLLSGLTQSASPTPLPKSKGSTTNSAEATLALISTKLNPQQPLAYRKKGLTTTSLSSLANLPSITAVRKNAVAPEGSTEEVVIVKSGDTLSRILNDRGVKIDQMPKLLTDDIVKKHLSNLRINQKLVVIRGVEGDFHSLNARIGNDRRITIRRSAQGFAIASIDLPVEKERVVTSGTIDQSLYVAAEQANLKQSTIMELADIFQWELDFARDIRKGDQFSLVYDRLYREGKYIGDGDILAAEFVRGGRTYRAIRFTSANGDTGYYSPDGRSKRRTFSRHPVEVVRITSKFDPNRVHPVLHKIRAHRGVDYGAPYGSPIHATADGKVTYSGTKNAYGNTVILQHGKKFSTLYAHMSKISNKSKVAKRVKQGDVIGYVGKTGRVTGTHLHYEFRINGKHADPLKIELPASQPLAAEYRGELRAISDELLTQMRSVLPVANAQMASATRP